MNRSIRMMLALLAAFSLFAAACGSDAGDVVEAVGDAADEAVDNTADAADDAMSDDAMEDEDHSGDDAMEDDAMEDDAMADEVGTIVDVAVGAGMFNTLVAAVTEAGLVDTLSGEGPFTVFAPTDDAFAEALDALGLTAEELLASPDLGSILTYHVVAGEVDAATAISLDGQSASTVNGAEIAISVVNGNVMVNDATVTTADIAASNGIIHVIDKVLLPPAAAEGDAMADAPGATDVGLVYDIGGRGDLSFNDSAAAGLERAKNELGWTTVEASPNDDGSDRAELLQLAAEANDMVLAVGFLFAGDAVAAAQANPDTNFAVIDDAMMDFDTFTPLAENAAGLTFAEEQGSFLVGAAAALKSENGKIGFIGGVCCFGLIEKFEAGYRAGALAVNPDIEIVTSYITDAPDFDGFNQPDQAKVIATTMYEEGADIIYHAAGGAGNGMFAAAKEYSEDNGTKVWGIGVDSDQYNTIGTVDESLQEYVLTSMLKRVDTAVFEILKDQAEGNFAPGIQVYDLSVDGVGYSTTGGYVDDIADQLDAFKAQIIAGDIVVPTDPTEVGA